MAAAYPINITINDGIGNGTDWYSSNRENNETEPGTITSQLWDMEAFHVNGNTLTMIGGYNFTSPSGYDGFRPGDLFIDVNGSGFYDFVATIGNSPSFYDVYALGNGSLSYDVYYSQNLFSNPWRYKSGGTLVESGLSAIYGFYDDGEGKHYTVDLDFSWLNSYVANGSTITIHNTMECGNDNLMAQYNYQVPEGGSYIAIIGLLLMIMFVHRRHLKA